MLGVPKSDQDHQGLFMDNSIALENAIRSLDGLSVGDAFGELFFRLSPHHTSPADLPSGTWRWTDDTHMALSIVEVLKTHGRIDQDALAVAFARRFAQEPGRGGRDVVQWKWGHILICAFICWHLFLKSLSSSTRSLVTFTRRVAAE